MVNRCLRTKIHYSISFHISVCDFSEIDVSTWNVACYSPIKNSEIKINAFEMKQEIYINRRLALLKQPNKYDEENNFLIL